MFLALSNKISNKNSENFGRGSHHRDSRKVISTLDQRVHNRQLTHRTVQTKDFSDFWVLGGLRATRKLAGEDYSRSSRYRT